jgi:TRAP-type C4-dicarboxylate transport system permease small subunit
MNPARIVGILLILAGALGLAYGGFSYTRDTHKAVLGPLELSVKDTQTVDVPLWASIAALVVGGGLVLFAGKSR